MADKTYDAVIIGGGAKGLITGMYLAKYGGMEVAIFDQKHEMGGGWCSDEGSVPGFVFDYHCVGVRPYYHFATERDFPEWKEEYGHMTRMVDVKTGLAGIFKEDQSSLIRTTCWRTRRKTGPPSRSPGSHRRMRIPGGG